MTQTPNLKLEEIQANRKTWAELMNNNLLLIDAAIGAYFVIQNLQGIWENSHAYTAGQTVVDGNTAAVWTCQVDHISAGIPSTFSEERAANPTFWSVYSSPARARGAWEPLTSYAVNDFVVSGSKYAVCIATHTSTADFDNDVASGYWSVLVDLSQVGSQVLPVLSGPADANKFVATNSGGTGYNIFDQAATLVLLGASSIGTSLLQTSSQAAARTAINAQVAGSYQAAAAYLAAISGLSVIAGTLPYIDSGGSAALATITTFGRNLIDDADAAAGRTTLGLGTAAVANTGTGSGNVPVLDASSRLPAVDGSLLTSLTATNLTGTVPRANGGFTPSEITASLGANVNLSATGSYFDGPSIAQGTSGTWFVSGNVTIQNTVGGDVVNVKLWDGTTVIASTRLHLVSVSGTYYGVAHLSGILASPAGNLRISVSPVARTDGAIAFNASGNSKDSTITGIRIG